MKVESIHIGQRVKHPQYGAGTVKAVNEHTADIRFDDGAQRTVAPDTSRLEPAEAQAELAGLTLPLTTLIKQTVAATVEGLGIEKPAGVLEGLANRWQVGRFVLHPKDPAAPTKEVELDVFFHKIVMVRNNLRVLEQKINAH